MPLLSGGDWKIASYVVRKTWGLRKQADRISARQVADGYVALGTRYDYGTGLNRRVVAGRMPQLYKLGVIVQVKPSIHSLHLGPLIRPGWMHEIDWDALFEKAGVERIDFEIGGANSYQTFIDVFHIDPHEDADEEEGRGEVGEKYFGLPNMKHYQEGRGKFIKDSGLEPAEYLLLVNWLLDGSGQRAIADMDSDLGLRALNKAHDTVQALITLGYKSIADFEFLREEYRKTWMYKPTANDKDPFPAPGNLINLGSKHIADARKAKQKKEAVMRDAEVAKEAEPIRVTAGDLFDDAMEW